MGPLTSTDTGLLVPPQVFSKEEVKPLTRGQKLVKRGLKALAPRGASVAKVIEKALHALCLRLHFSRLDRS
jgi:hypothetical protein